MDGIAFVYSEWEKGRREFKIEGIQAAGMPPLTLAAPIHCVEVMTGAELPAGTDTVVPYEDLRIEGKTAHVVANRVLPGQNLHLSGSDAKKGSPLLPVGTLISPAEIALLATVGKESVNVFDFPSAAVVSSGDELVAVTGDGKQPVFRDDCHRSALFRERPSSVAGAGFAAPVHCSAWFGVPLVRSAVTSAAGYAAAVPAGSSTGRTNRTSSLPDNRGTSTVATHH